ncbi:hypothetical protein Glove_227g70 [Diversispora epigaea]|uniref:Apple domain-containing protein n=1 Tax=Diversispora epigaea TaxID=1348612 RepID=A0A397IGV0_9GLOM|nr:hypothetical protein Glove_227g70 [Diversispora epigaea]
MNLLIILSWIWIVASILTINAHAKPKPCKTVTKTLSNTVTVSTCNSLKPDSTKLCCPVVTTSPLKHNNKIKTKTVTCAPTVSINHCPTCCSVSGGAGWGNFVRPAAGGNSTEVQASSAKECCNACLADSNCIQWAFLINGVCINNNNGPGACSFATGLCSPGVCGVIRCTGSGCLNF